MAFGKSFDHSPAQDSGRGYQIIREVQDSVMQTFVNITFDATKNAYLYSYNLLVRGEGGCDFQFSQRYPDTGPDSVNDFITQVREALKKALKTGK